jgi:hypothetical protein
MKRERRQPTKRELEQIISRRPVVRKHSQTTEGSPFFKNKPYFEDNQSRVTEEKHERRS